MLKIMFETYCCGRVLPLIFWEKKNILLFKILVIRMTCLFSVCWMTKKSTMIQWQSEPRSKTVAFFYFKDFTGTPVVWERTYFLSRMDPVLAVSSSRVLIITSMQDQNCVKKNKKRKMLNKSACVFIDNDNLTLLIPIFYRPVVSILIKTCFLSV